MTYYVVFYLWVSVQTPSIPKEKRSSLKELSGDEYVIPYFFAKTDEYNNYFNTFFFHILVSVASLSQCMVVWRGRCLDSVAWGVVWIYSLPQAEVTSGSCRCHRKCCCKLLQPQIVPLLVNRGNRNLRKDFDVMTPDAQWLRDTEVLWLKEEKGIIGTSWALMLNTTRLSSLRQKWHLDINGLPTANKLNWGRKLSKIHGKCDTTSIVTQIPFPECSVKNRDKDEVKFV